MEHCSTNIIFPAACYDVYGFDIFQPLATLLGWQERIDAKLSSAKSIRLSVVNDHTIVCAWRCQKQCLAIDCNIVAMPSAVVDVIAEEDVRALTPDDLQLLLSGKPSQRF